MLDSKKDREESIPELYFQYTYNSNIQLTKKKENKTEFRKYKMIKKTTKRERIEHKLTH